MILTLQTTTFGHPGGIPAYNRLVCRVLNELELLDDRRLLIGRDERGEVTKAAPSFDNLTIEAFEGSKAGFVRRVLKLAAGQNISLTLIGHVNYAPLCFLLKRLQPKMRYGVFVYGTEVWERLPRLRRNALRQADFIISISDYTRRRAAQANGLREERIHLLPNALEWNLEEAEDAVGDFVLSEGTRLLSVCRLDAAEQQKGVDDVIKALPALIAAAPDVQYVVVGGGTDMERHRQLALACGVAERVHFLGFVSEAVLRACYRQCDVFVMPSAQEGFGFVYLEAMHCGKPVVAANSGGAPEVVEDGVTGTLVRYGDVPQLTRALADLCLSPEKRRQLGRAGHRHLHERFTYRQFKDELTRIIGQELPRASDMESSVSIGGHLKGSTSSRGARG